MSHSLSANISRGQTEKIQQWLPTVGPHPTVEQSSHLMATANLSTGTKWKSDSLPTSGHRLALSHTSPQCFFSSPRLMTFGANREELGLTRQYSVIPLGSALRNPSLHSGDSMGYQGSSLNELHAKQALSPLCYHSIPNPHFALSARSGTWCHWYVPVYKCMSE